MNASQIAPIEFDPVGGVERIRVWDLPLRLFHWLLVAAIAVAFLSSEGDSAINEWHVLTGWTAAVLIVFRLAWGFVGGEHSRFSDFIRPSRVVAHLRGLFRGRPEAELGHNPLGAIAVVVLLVLTGITVWTGAFGGEAAEELHEVIAWTLLAMVGLHVAAVIAMSVAQRENLARAMVTGAKPAARHPGASDARPAGAVGIVVGLLVIAGTAYAILQYDPQAFTPRSAESFEDRVPASGGSAALEREVGEDED